MTPVASRRLAAALALVAGALTLVFAALLVGNEADRSPFLVASVVVALAAGAYGIVRRGPRRVLGVAVAALLLLNLVVGIVEEEGVLPPALIVSALVTSAAATRALRVEVQWPPVAAQ